MEQHKARLCLITWTSPLSISRHSQIDLVQEEWYLVKEMYDSSKILNTNPSTPPPLPSKEEKTYYLVINGTQIGNQTFNQIKTFIQQGIVTEETLVWTAGMENWEKLIDVAPLNNLLQSKKTSLPPPVPNLLKKKK